MRKLNRIRIAASLLATAGLLMYVVSQYRAAFRQVMPVPTLGSILLPYFIGAAFVLSAVLFLLSLAGLWREWRRNPLGHCQKCGYYLTGNTSGICPECGKPVSCS
jgi:hypothetical protein